jgi:hypothetical protein
VRDRAIMPHFGPLTAQMLGLASDPRRPWPLSEQILSSLAPLCRRSTGDHPSHVASFAHRHHVGNGHAIEHVGDCLANLCHRKAHRAGFHALAICAWLISRSASTCDGRERSVDLTDDMPDFDVAGRPREHITAPGTLSGVNDAGVAQLNQNDIKKFLRNIARLGYRNPLSLFSRLEAGEVDQRLERVLSFGCEHAGTLAFDAKL